MIHASSFSCPKYVVFGTTSHWEHLRSGGILCLDWVVRIVTCLSRSSVAGALHLAYTSTLFSGTQHYSFTKGPLRILTTSPIRNSGYDEARVKPISEGHALASIMDIIMPRIDRWKELHIQTNHRSSLKPLRELLGGAKHALQLKELTISTAHHIEHPFALDAHPSVASYIDLPHTFGCRLQLLSLTGTSPRLQSAGLTNLSILRLADCPLPILLSGLHAALSTCNNLRELDLSELELAHDMQTNASHSITLPHLQRLSLTSLFDPADTVAVLQLVRAPSLHVLHLEESWKDVIETDIIDMLSDARYGYPSIIHLTVDGLASDKWLSFFQQHRFIEQLSAADSPNPSVYMHTLLEALCSSIPIAGTGFYAFPLPSLRELEILSSPSARMDELVHRLGLVRTGLVYKYTVI